MGFLNPRGLVLFSLVFLLLLGWSLARDVEEDHDDYNEAQDIEDELQ